MITPRVHLNGTSRKDLDEGYRRAYEALSAALTALEECAPNGRDYYPIGPHAITVAVEEHLARLVAVAKAKDDMMHLHIAVTTEGLIR